jgi:GDPmannose 4,6-dehydratase
MIKTALVTGATGQDGRYLVALLRRRGYAVHAQSRSRQPEATDAGVRWHIGDLTDPGFLEALILEARPREIYNLAAVSRPVLSWQAPRLTAETNALVPQQLCELMVKHLPGARLFQASSSEMFGDGLTGAQDETTHCVPKSPYGVAKLYAHHIVGAYRQQFGLHACCGIMFNHESPFRPLSFVSQKIAYAAAHLARGVTDSPDLDERGQAILSQGMLMLGDLDVRRDFGFAGDYAEAMHLILQHPTADDYVVGTGKDHSIREFCEVAFRSVGLDWSKHVVSDSKLLRKTDNHFTRANSDKLRSVVGWQPRVSFESLVEIMVSAQLQALDGGVASARPGAENGAAFSVG